MPSENTSDLTLSDYSGNLKINLSPFYHTDLTNTLEKILLIDRSEKNKGILEKIFVDKSNTLKTTFKALIQEIELRETLNLHLLKRMNENISDQNIQLEQLKKMTIANYDFDWFMDRNKIQLQLEGNILELEKEKRKEYLECWRDLMFLKKYLLVAFKEYWDMVQKREVLEGDVSELIDLSNKTPVSIQDD